MADKYTGGQFSSRKPGKTKTVVGELTGLSPLVASVSGPWASLTRLLKSARTVIVAPRYNRDGGDDYHGMTPEERFTAEVSRERMSTQAIMALAIRATKRAALAAVLTLALFIYAVIHTIATINGESAFATIFGLSYVWVFVAALAAYALRENLRAYQLRSHRLVTFIEWLRAWRRVSPLQIEYQDRAPPILNIAIATIAGAAIWAALAHPAFAQAAGPRGQYSAGASSTPMQNAYGILSNLGPGDLSGQWLSRLFPSLTGGQPGMLASMFAAFNTIILDIGGGFVFWEMAQGLVYAAQNGSLRGSSVHIPYSPIRTFIGGAALAPVLGGYCLAQAVALQVLGTGYYMADQLYAQMVGATFSPTAISQSIAQFPLQGMDRLLVNGLQAETCFAWYQTNSEDLAAVGVPPDEAVLAAAPEGAAFASDSSSATPWDGSPSEVGANYNYNMGYCGTLSVPAEGQTSGNNAGSGEVAFSGGDAFDQTRNTALQTYLQGLWASGLPKALAAMISANAGQPISSSASPASPPTAQQLNTDYGNALTAATQYLTSTRSAAATLANSSLGAYATALKSTSGNLGWVSAGALYSAISQMYIHSAGAISDSTPTLTLTSLHGVSPSEQSHIEASYNIVGTFMQSAVLPSSSTMTTGPNATIAPTGGSALTDESASQRILNEPAAGLLFRTDHMLLLDPANPVGSIAEEGTIMIYSGGAMVGASWLANMVPFGKTIAKTLQDGVGGAPGFFASLASKGLAGMTILGEFLIVVGSFETYVVPMLFYITWMFAIVNSIAFAAEFVLAAPLAAFQHMRIFGEQAINEQQKAFYVISFLNGILRPSFLLFGLAISTYVLSAISQVLNATFNLAVASSLGGAVVGPIGIIVFILMLGYLQYQLMIRSVHLITRAPDAVADLVGGFLGRLGGSADEGLGLGQGVYGQSRAVTSGIMKVASTPVAKVAAGAGGGVPGNLQQ